MERGADFRIKLWFVLALAAIMSVFIILLYLSASTSGWGRGGDFAVFYEAAQRVRGGQPLYIPGPMTYMNPPFFAWMLQPITFFPQPVARFVWTMVNYLLLLLSCRLLLHREDRGLPGRFWLLASVLSVPVIVGIVTVGQNTPLVLFALILAYTLHTQGKGTAAGIALALGLIKPHLLIGPVLLLLVARQWRDILGFGIASICLIALSVMLVGAGGVIRYLQIVGDATGWVRRGEFFRSDMHTPNGILHQFAPSWVADIAVILVGAVIVYLILLRAWRVREMNPQIFTLGIVGGLLITPYAHTYDLMLLVVPWLLFGPGASGWQLWTLVGSYLAPLIHLLLSAAGWYGPIVTVTMLISLFSVLLGPPHLIVQTKGVHKERVGDSAS